MHNSFSDSSTAIGYYRRIWERICKWIILFINFFLQILLKTELEHDNQHEGYWYIAGTCGVSPVEFEGMRLLTEPEIESGEKKGGVEIFLNIERQKNERSFLVIFFDITFWSKAKDPDLETLQTHISN